MSCRRDEVCGRRATARRGRWARRLGCGLALAATSCAWGRDEEADALETFNRPVFAFNQKLDDWLLGPLADVYDMVVPPPLKMGVANFFDNVGYPGAALNAFLQGKVGQGACDFGRFAINSTLGLGGIFDVATRMGLEAHEEDLGQTLGVWGLGEGSYLVLPVLGPTSLRDAPGFAMSRVTSVMFFVTDPSLLLGGIVVGGMDKRSRAGRAIETIEATALDPYVWTRESYRQHRRFLTYDGNPPTPTVVPELDEMQQLEEMEKAEKKERDEKAKKDGGR